MMRSPAAPYRPLNSDIFKKGKCRIVEIPVTTIPFLRFPIHFSYLMLGGKYYAQLVCMVLKKTYARLRFINYLFHPLDLMNSQDVRFAKKIFGLNIPLAVKLALAKKMLKFFKANYQIVTSKEMYEVVKETV
jgi:hypothetical protein